VFLALAGDVVGGLGFSPATRLVFIVRILADGKDADKYDDNGA